MSVVGFVLGLGDRHGENLLIDIKSGDSFHVDFNLLFNKGEFLAVPEVRVTIVVLVSYIFGNNRPVS